MPNHVQNEIVFENISDEQKKTLLLKMGIVYLTNPRFSAIIYVTERHLDCRRH